MANAVTLVFSSGERLVVSRRAILSASSPVFDALNPDELEIPILGLSFEAVQLFFAHVEQRTPITVDSIFVVAPVAHFFGVSALLDRFVAFVVDNYTGEIGRCGARTLDLVVLLERYRTRTKGACPWTDLILLDLLAMRAEFKLASYDTQPAALNSGPFARVVEREVWDALKPETRTTMSELSALSVNRPRELLQRIYPTLSLL